MNHLFSLFLLLTLASTETLSSELPQFTKVICHHRSQVFEKKILNRQSLGHGGDYHCDWEEYKETSRVTICKQINSNCEYQCHSEIMEEIVHHNVTCL